MDEVSTNKYDVQFDVEKEDVNLYAQLINDKLNDLYEEL